MRTYWHKKKRTLFRTYLLFFILLFILVISYNAVRGMYATYKESSEVRGGLEEEYAVLLEKQHRLKGELALLETPRGEEEEIRDRFRVARPEEHMAIIVIEEEKQNSASVIESVKKPWWSIFTSWFSGS
ncbi:MAG: hypothetical protein WDZ88_03415 [Candidatus Paceibacterota bacterium]